MSPSTPPPPQWDSPITHLAAGGCPGGALLPLGPLVPFVPPLAPHPCWHPEPNRHPEVRLRSSEVPMPSAVSGWGGPKALGGEVRDGIPRACGCNGEEALELVAVAVMHPWRWWLCALLLTSTLPKQCQLSQRAEQLPAQQSSCLPHHFIIHHPHIEGVFVDPPSPRFLLCHRAAPCPHPRSSDTTHSPSFVSFPFILSFFCSKTGAALRRAGGVPTVSNCPQKCSVWPRPPPASP